MVTMTFHADWVTSSHFQKENKSNEYVDDARAEARRKGRRECDILREWYKDARRCGDSAAAKKIYTAQKYLGCRGTSGEY